MPGGQSLPAKTARTWMKPTRIDSGGQKLAAETDIIELKDGRLFAALRGDGEQQMCYSVSRDHGRSWSTAKAIGFLGHCPYPASHGGRDYPARAPAACHEPEL